jgi:hypothetical protein
MSAEIEQVSLAVAAIDRVETGLATLRERYAGLVFEVATSEGMKAAKEARKAVRDPRLEVERIRKAAKAPILALGKKLDSTAARITAELEKLEDPIAKQITAEEEREEREKQARIEAELARVTGLQERVAELRGAVAAAMNCSAALILEHIADLERVPVDASFEEFEEQAQDAKTATLARLKELHTAAVSREAEAERIKAERAELAKLRAEQEARDKVAREAQAKLDAEAKAERDRLEALAKAEQHAAAEQLRQERAAFEREQAEHQAKLRADLEAELRKSAPARVSNERPTDEEIIECVATHFGVGPFEAFEWLMEIKSEVA